MGINDDFAAMFEILQQHNVYSTTQFRKDIRDLVNSEQYKFIQKFLNDFSRINLKDYKRYERLKLTDTQNKKMDGKSLFRYSYRNNQNLRCIYTIQDENNKTTILLNAFNEDGGKKKGRGSYNFNIERAINTYQKIKEENLL